MKQISILFLLFLISLPGCSQKENANTDQWFIVPHERLYATIDTTFAIEGRHPVCLRAFPSTNSKNTPVLHTLYRTFSVPEAFNSFSISLNTKCENIEKAKLYVTGLDWDENVLFYDSLDIKAAKWTKKAFSFPVRKSAFLNVRMQVTGDTVHLQKEQTQSMWYDTIIVKADNRNLHSSKPIIKTKDEQLNKEKITPVNINEYAGLYPLFAGKTIIGLGETIHGSKEIGQASYNLIKNRILQGNCRMILLEVPLDISLLWELYIQGILPEESLVEITKEINILSPFQQEEITSELLRWLRKYNRQNAGKVHLFGMDVVSGWPYRTRIAVRDFITTYVNDSNVEGLFPLLDFLHKRDGCLLSECFKEYEAYLIDQIGTDYFEILASILSQYTIRVEGVFLAPFMERGYYYGIISRDCFMWANTKMLVDLFLKENETAIIYAHNGHLNKLNTFVYPQNYSLGYYLSQHYGDKYVSVAILSGSGYYTGMDFVRNMFKEEVLLPPDNSIEKLCQSVGLDMFCYPVDAIPDNVRYIRHIGRGDQGNEQFKYQATKRRNDYIIYIDKSSPAESWFMKNGTKQYSDIFFELQEQRDREFVDKMRIWKQRTLN
jgi:erythromycin esterase-like protein